MAFYSQYLNIQDSAATPANTFFVDSTSVDNGNNTGWVFVNGIFVFPASLTATTALGDATVSADATFDVTGLQALSQLGNIALSTNNNISVTGLEATGSVGDATVAGASNFTLTGLEATSALGSVTTTSESDIAVTGFAALSQLGNISLVTNNNIVVTGFEATTALGSVQGKADATIVIPPASDGLEYLDIQDCIAAGLDLPFVAHVSVDSGNNVNWVISDMRALPSLVPFLNSVTVTGIGNITPTGVQAEGQVGFGLVWGLINDNQNPNWVDIPN